jgi:hypothetical protein
MVAQDMVRESKKEITFLTSKPIGSKLLIFARVFCDKLYFPPFP